MRTRIYLLGLALPVIAYSLYLIYYAIQGEKIYGSHFAWAISKPIVAFALGVLFSHLYWPNNKADEGPSVKRAKLLQGKRGIK